MRVLTIYGGSEVQNTIMMDQTHENREHNNKTENTIFLDCDWTQCKSSHSSIHPFSKKLILHGGLEPIPVVIGRETGETLDRSTVHNRMDI